MNKKLSDAMSDIKRLFTSSSAEPYLRELVNQAHVLEEDVGAYQKEAESYQEAYGILSRERDLALKEIDNLRQQVLGIERRIDALESQYAEHLNILVEDLTRWRDKLREAK